MFSNAARPSALRWKQHRSLLAGGKAVIGDNLAIATIERTKFASASPKSLLLICQGITGIQHKAY